MTQFTHLTEADLEALVTCPAPAADDPRLVHLAECAACARRLTRQAQVELALYDAVAAGEQSTRELPRVAARSGRWPYALMSAAMLGVAVVVAVFFSSGPRRPAREAASSPQVVPSVETPCLEDPRALGPGSGVVSPTSICRDITVPLQTAPIVDATQGPVFEEP